MSIEIDPKIERDLTELAVLNNMSVNALLREFTIEQKRYWKERAEDQASLEAMENGDYISQDAMFSKMDKMIGQAQKLAEDID
jgi:predicted transcriptional regulator